MCISRFPQNYPQVLIGPHGIGSALGFTLRVLGLPLGSSGALYSHGGKAGRHQSQLGTEPGCERGWYAIPRRFGWVLRCRVPARFDYIRPPFCLQKEVGPGYSPEDAANFQVKIRTQTWDLGRSERRAQLGLSRSQASPWGLDCSTLIGSRQTARKPQPVFIRASV